jgi:hypothetical protein
MLLITALRSLNFFNESGTGHITAGIRVATRSIRPPPHNTF